MKKAADYLILFFCSIFMIESEPVTLKWVVCNPDEVYPDLFGFPLIAQTSIPWVNSMEQSVYLQGYLVDLLFWGALFTGIYLLLKRTNIRDGFRKFARVSLLILGSIYFALIVWYSYLFRWPEWTHGMPLDGCSPELVFFPIH